MKLLIQRVSEAAVWIDDAVYSRIDRGILALVGVRDSDREEDALYLTDKLIHLRIFPDTQGKMNCSLIDIHGDLLIVSQFTLYGDCRRGRRPSFTDSAAPEPAKALIDFFIDQCRAASSGKVETGIFAADMKVQLVNEGPVTFCLESERRKGLNQ